MSGIEEIYHDPNGEVLVHKNSSHAEKVRVNSSHAEKLRAAGFRQVSVFQRDDGYIVIGTDLARGIGIIN